MDHFSANHLHDVNYPVTLFKNEIEIVKSERLNVDFQWPDFTEFLIKIKS